MFLDPILSAVLAMAVGPIALYRERRGLLHKLLGYLWVLLIAQAALSSFFITGLGVIGPFGPIHILSVLTLWGLWRGVGHARAGRIAAHRATMRTIFTGALVVAGTLSLLPGRRISLILFGENAGLALVTIAVLLTALALRWVWTTPHGKELRRRGGLPLHKRAARG